MFFKRILLTICLMSLLYPGIANAGKYLGKLPELKAVKTLNAPVIDGKLNDQAWEKAAVASAFRTVRDHIVAKAQTKVLLTYDDKNLYLGVSCQEPEPGKIKAHKFTNEKEIWQDDVVAIFIKPDISSEDYYQLAVNPLGMKFDQKNTSHGVYYDKYSPQWKVKTSTDAKSWTAEIAIPFASIGVKAQMGQLWRMNFCRTRKANKISSSWCMVFNWHSPENWGFVNNFVIGSVGDNKLELSDVKTVKVSGNTILKAVINNETSKKMQLSGKLDVVSPAGDKKSLNIKINSLPAKGKVQFAAPYNLSLQEGMHSLTLSLLKGGRLLYKSPPMHTSIGKKLLDCYVQRSYYASEKEAGIVCLISPEIKTALLKNMQLKCEMAGTKLAKTFKGSLKRKMIFNFPLQGIPDKNHEVVVKLTNTKGAVISSQKLTLIKLPPPKGSEVKIVRWDKGAGLLSNGKPLNYIANLVSDDERFIYKGDTIKEMKDAGFDTILCWRGDVKDAISALKTARQFDMMVGVSVEHWYGFKGLRKDLALLIGKYDNPSPNESPRIKKIRAKIKKIQDKIRQIKDHPNLLFWRNLDEPGIGNMPANRLFTKIIKEVDPYHPVELGTGPPATGLKYKYRDECGEIYDTHSYLHGNRPMITPYDRAHRAKYYTDKDRKVSAAFLTGNTSWSYRGLTAKEQRCEVYLGIIGGWRCLKWFRGRIPMLECWNNVKKLAGELKVLAPILATPESEQNFKIIQPEPKKLYALLLEHKGKKYLLAANSGSDKIKVQFVFSGLKAGTPVKVLFENRNLKSGNKVIKDTFDAKGVHVYEFTGK